MTNREKIKVLMNYCRVSKEIEIIKDSYRLYYSKIYSVQAHHFSDRPNSSTVTDKISNVIAN